MSSPRSIVPTSPVRWTTVLGAALLVTACANGEEAASSAPVETEAASDGASSHLVDLLRTGEPVFGVFSGPQTREQGATMASESDADFILYSMESGPFDVEGMEAYLAGMTEAGGAGALQRLPVVLRVPPIDDVAAARAQLQAALPTGIAGIVFPHVARPDQAAASAELLPGSWPQDPTGDQVNILIVEDHEGIENVRDIMATPGLSVVFAGPGDLRRAYEGDMEQVESAIQAVLAACKEFEVVCGVTAGVEDIGERLEQGFGMIIVTEPEAVAAGKAAAGRAG
jgi:2-keto-3-deoxy-L-rhamnonate aldolase RhmA